MIREYRTIDKSGWRDGAWQNEPDKVQWVDEATGLDCLIVRNGGGALCGYVGVPEGHPWHGLDYMSCTQRPTCDDRWCEHSPETLASVHGGITFAASCFDPSRERFAEFQRRMEASTKEVKKYPRGDAADRLKRLGHLVGDYDAWREHVEATAICHVAADGRPDHVWWFGFDCAHSGDLCPKYDQYWRQSIPGLGDTYRNLEYVRRETQRLAAQLLAVVA